MFTGHEMKKKCFDLWRKEINGESFIGNTPCFMETKDKKESENVIKNYISLCSK